MQRVKLAVLAVLLCVAGAAPGRAAGGSDWCAADRAPKINIKTSTDQVLWQYDKSEKDLNNFTIDTVNPYGKNIITDVGGLMQGGIELNERMTFHTLTNNRVAQICYWYDTIEVSLHIRPTIYIAREFPQNTCKHNAIREHELKHIETDREIVNKYAALIGAGIKTELDRQTTYGPYRLAQAAEIETFMKSRLTGVLNYYSGMMEKERQQRQQAIDSLAEYQRVNSLCQ